MFHGNRPNMGPNEFQRMDDSPSLCVVAMGTLHMGCPKFGTPYIMNREHSGEMRYPTFKQHSYMAESFIYNRLIRTGFLCFFLMVRSGWNIAILHGHCENTTNGVVEATNHGIEPPNLWAPCCKQEIYTWDMRIFPRKNGDEKCLQIHVLWQVLIPSVAGKNKVFTDVFFGMITSNNP